MSPSFRGVCQLNIQTWFLFIATATSLLVGAYSHAELNHRLNSNFGSIRPTFVPDAQLAKFVSLGFDRLVADYFWLSFIGYLGDSEKRKHDHFALAERYIDLIIALDPQFIEAYWFAAFTVGGDMHDPDRAARILEIGIENNPENWYLPFIAGMNQYLYAGDELAAARFYRIASKYPGAPDWFVRQAQIMENKAPRLVKEANSWLNIYNAAENDAVRERAMNTCIRLWVQVYKTAPNDEYRQKAREVLGRIGVDVITLERRR